MAEKATIARPYAKAAFQLAQQHQAFPRWSQALARTAAGVQDERVARLLLNPRVTAADLAALLAEIAGEALEDNSRNFITTLANNRRLALLPEIAAMFEIMRAEAENMADVQVTSAVQLDEAQRQRLAAALKKRLNRDVRL